MNLLRSGARGLAFAGMADGAAAAGGRFVWLIDARVIAVDRGRCVSEAVLERQGDAGVDEPNETPTNGRGAVCHAGERQPSRSAPQEIHFGANHDAGYRVPHIVADLAAARPVDLAIIDGIESIAGGEGPWIRSKPLRLVQPGVLIVGTNPVTTDTVATAVMGYNP